MLFSQDLAIDLGTSETLVYLKGKGVTMREPSVVAMDIRQQKHRLVAVGDAAKEMIGRTPGSVIARSPLKNGVISDYEMTADLLKAIVKKALYKYPLASARVMLSIPSGVTEVERRAVHEAARNAGAKYVSLMEATMAAAIGARLPVTQPLGSMVADLGAGTSEVAVTSLGDVVSSDSVRVGGDDMDDAVIAYIRKKYDVLIGKRTAEDVKIKLGSAAPYENEASMIVKGRKLSDGLPASIEINSYEIREALSDVVMQITDMICDALERTPPELAADIIDHGIVLTGGGAMLKGMGTFLRDITKMPVKIADNPRDCVVIGMGRCLEKNAVNRAQR